MRHGGADERGSQSPFGFGVLSDSSRPSRQSTCGTPGLNRLSASASFRTADVTVAIDSLSTYVSIAFRLRRPFGPRHIRRVCRSLHSVSIAFRLRRPFGLKLLDDGACPTVLLNCLNRLSASASFRTEGEKKEMKIWARFSLNRLSASASFRTSMKNGKSFAAQITQVSIAFRLRRPFGPRKITKIIGIRIRRLNRLSASASFRTWGSCNPGPAGTPVASLNRLSASASFRTRST